VGEVYAGEVDREVEVEEVEVAEVEEEVEGA